MGALLLDRAAVAVAVATVVTMLVLIGTFWPLMDPNSRYSVSNWKTV